MLTLVCELEPSFHSVPFFLKFGNDGRELPNDGSILPLPPPLFCLTFPFHEAVKARLLSPFCVTFFSNSSPQSFPLSRIDTRILQVDVGFFPLDTVLTCRLLIHRSLRPCFWQVPNFSPAAWLQDRGASPLATLVCVLFPPFLLSFV